MNAEIVQRPEWEIDKRLKALIGENVRVRVAAFCPPKWNGEPMHVIPASDFVLPDNSTVHRDELYFEGKLLAYQRKVAVVFAILDRLTLEGETANGRVLFRGRQAVVLQGPATVQMHSAHFVERLPDDFKFYWTHIAATHQFELPFDF